MTTPRLLRPRPPFIDRSGCRLLPISSASLFPHYTQRKRSWPPPSRRLKPLRVACSTFPTCRKHMPSLLDPSFVWPIWQQTGSLEDREGRLDADATRQLLTTTHPDVHRLAVNLSRLGWRDTPSDVFICPAAATISVKEGTRLLTRAHSAARNRARRAFVRTALNSPTATAKQGALLRLRAAFIQALSLPCPNTLK